PIDLDVQQTAETLRLLRRSPGAPASDSGVFEWLEDVMALYRGEFLSGVTIPDAPDLDAWMEGQRTHWRGVEEEILDRVATMQVEAGDRGAALGTLERWTWVNPDEEMAWYRLIDLYVQFLDQAGARRAWRRYCDVMADLDVEPSEDVTSLATRIDEIQVCRPAPVGAVEIGRNEPEVQNIPFVGRSREQSLLLSAFERSRGGQTEVIIVTGEEGIGKTRLVSQLLRTAEERGADIVTGQALETIDELPYAMLTDALRTRMDAENAPDDLLGDHWLAELARLMPELRERYPDLPPATDDPYLARGRLLEAVARFGQALAERKPLVIFLDDVQWSDVVTLDAVRYAVHRWARHGSPVLLVLAARDVGGQDEPLARWINGMKRDVPVLHLGIGVLQPQIVVQGPRNPAFSRETISSSPPVVPPSAARDHVLSGPF
ncbi:MAG TPA: AAA family ATPase, partial [Thermomicrobiaceae bacterium]|nr:AAA family ATPase [Thermomicrobiaceae bacterium]